MERQEQKPSFPGLGICSTYCTYAHRKADFIEFMFILAEFTMYVYMYNVSNLSVSLFLSRAPFGGGECMWEGT